MSNIRLGTAANVRAFQLLNHAVETSNYRDSIDREALQDEFGRFRVWSGNLGALQKGHSSLDYRLRDSPLLSSNVLKLLKELEDNLDSFFAVVSGARLPYEQQVNTDKDGDDENDDFFSEDEDEGSDQGAPKTELEMRFREVVDIIDNLYKLSVRIRQPTIRTRSLKAASYRPKDPDTGIDILEQYAVFDVQHTFELIRHLRIPHERHTIGDDDILVRRLGRAITLRRRHFKYWRRHRDKLGISAIPDELKELPSTDRPDVPQRHDTLEVQPGPPIVPSVKDAPSQKTGKTMLSGTEATHYHQSLDDIVDSKSVTSYATTVRDLSGKGVELPPPPKVADGEKDFECPYCFIICPARYGRGRPWRTHLLQDLQPYVCTYEECNLPDQLFRSRREWSEHEATHRKAWRCPEHPSAVYRSDASLRDHLRIKHAGSFPEHQLNSIVKIGETSTVDVRPACPICCCPSADIEGMGGLQNHIANHLERIATFALPPLANDESDGASSAASRGRTGSSDSRVISYISSNTNSVGVDDVADFKEDAPSQAALLHELPSFLESVTDDSETLPRREALSSESLRHLPDASQKRLDILLSSLTTRTHDVDDFSLDEVTTEIEEHMAEMERFRRYLLSLTGAQSVRFYKRYGSSRGTVRFKDETSATVALKAFDTVQFSTVELRRGEENKASIKFSFSAPDQIKKEVDDASAPGQQELSSASSDTVSYGNEDQEGLPPILIASEVPTLRSLYRSGKLQQKDQSYTAIDGYSQMICFCQYDITRLKVDAIVNSANCALKMTKSNATLNHTVHKAAGPGLKRECKGIGKIKAGQAALTAGYNLPSAYVIHAARPSFGGGKGTGQYNVLTQCYRSALQIALSHGFKTLAFPSLGAGGVGFPTRAAARIALQEVREFLDAHEQHSFERIVFCVYSAIDEKAYQDFLPVFFPPTQADINNAVSNEFQRNRATLGVQLTDTHTQILLLAPELVDFSDRMTDFPTHILEELSSITSALEALKYLLLGPRETISNLKDRTTSDLDLICSVLKAVCSSVTEIIELAKGKANLGQPSYKTIWEDYNTHMRISQGLDFLELLEICRDFIQSLEKVLVHDEARPSELATMSVRLAGWLLKQTGKGEKAIHEHFEEVMYSREFQRGTAALRRTDIVKLHQIPSIARLYQLGELAARPTAVIPNSRHNYTVCLIREDITRLEVDVLVNSTDRSFSGAGTLDRAIFRKGGPEMQNICTSFGYCKVGDIKLTAGYLLPAKHVYHAIPPETYRSNTKAVLRGIYREILRMAASMKATSIAIPAIGTGMLAYPRRDCAALAMEEVKTFLESDMSGTMEKIVFVIYGSNDEFVYKTLLPIYFPPLDLDAKSALPASHAPSTKPIDVPDRNESSSPPRRSLFGSIGEAIRGVRFSKQTVIQKQRSLQPGEEHALISFERHAVDCPTCRNIHKLYVEGRNLCEEGYGIAQLVLQYLYMEADQAVYSTHLDGGKRMRVEIPMEYSISWELLVAVEKSFHDVDRTQPFVSPNQPWPGEIGKKLETTGIEAGSAVENTTVTLPIFPKEQERAVAIVKIWNDVLQTWKLLEPWKCSLRIYPDELRIYHNEAHAGSQPPILSLPFTSLAEVKKYSSLEVLIDMSCGYPRSNDNLTERFIFEVQSPAECEMLYRRLDYAATNGPKSQAHVSTNDSTALGLLSTSGDGVTPQKTSLAESVHSTRIQAPALTLLGQRVLAYLRALPPTTAGLTLHELAAALDTDVADTEREIDCLKSIKLVHPVFGNSQAWAATSSDDPPPALPGQRRYRESEGVLEEDEPSETESEPNLSPELPPSEAADALLAGLSNVEIAERPDEQLGDPEQLALPPPPKNGASDIRPVGLSLSNIHNYFGYFNPATDLSPQHPEWRPSQPSSTKYMSSQEDGLPTAKGSWTIIDRRLVSSKVLEEAGEQFAETERGFLVRRILTNEEVLNYGLRTPGRLHRPGPTSSDVEVPGSSEPKRSIRPFSFDNATIKFGDYVQYIERPKDAPQSGPESNKNHDVLQEHHGFDYSGLWTKLDKIVVSPQALKERNETYHEEDNSLIVHRMLDLATQMRLVERTIEIRAEESVGEEAGGAAGSGAGKKASHSGVSSEE